MSFICPNCGENNRETAKECARCGYDMVNWPHVVSAEPEPEPDPIRETFGGFRDEFWHSIFITIFCCFIPGIFGIYYSVAARKMRDAGDLKGAIEAAKVATILNNIGFAIGVVIAGWQAWVLFIRQYYYY